MSSTQENNKAISFDTYEIDQNLNKNEEVFKYKKEYLFRKMIGVDNKIFNEINNESDEPKYIVDLQKLNYIGILSGKFNKDIFGFSKINEKQKYLGEYKKNIKYGKGICEILNDDNIKIIYAGEFRNDNQEGKGIKFEFKEDIEYDFICYIGTFNDSIIREGFSIERNEKINIIYKGKFDFEGLKNDDNGFIIENNDIFKGKIIKDKIYEGCVISENKKFNYRIIETVDEKGIKCNEPVYEYDKDENKKVIEYSKKLKEKFDLENIKKIFKKIKGLLEKFKNYKEMYKLLENRKNGQNNEFEDLFIEIESYLNI